MKPLIFFLLFFCVLLSSSFAQSPDSFRYQTVVRDNNGNIRQNDALSMRLSILQGSETGTEVYKETHALSTNEFGLVSLSVGNGTAEVGEFDTINWSNGPYFLQVEMDTAAGVDFVLMGTSQLLSVPYALYAKNGNPVGQNPGDMLYWNGVQWVNVAAGTNGQVLTFNNGVPTWTGILPTITTTSVTSITYATALSGGNVTTSGNSPVIEKGICWNTSPNPTIADSKTADGNGTGSFTSNLIGLAANTSFFVRAYATNSLGTIYGNQVIFSTMAFPCGTPVVVNHVAGTIAPITKTTTYGTVTNIPGETSKCWITQNLGSDHQATAVDDATEASAGWYWQFNKKQGYKHDGINLIPNNIWIYPIIETSDWMLANDPCTLELGNGWRIPTGTEWTNVDASGGWINWNGPWNSGLKLHAAGYLIESSGSLSNRELYGAGSYWSSVQNGALIGWYMYFDSGNSHSNTGAAKAQGCSLRCIRN